MEENSKEQTYYVEKIQRVSEIRTKPSACEFRPLSYFADVIYALGVDGRAVGYSQSKQTLLIPYKIKPESCKEAMKQLQEQGYDFAQDCRFINFVSRVSHVPYICTIPRRGIQAIECFPDAEVYLVDDNVLGYSPAQETLLVLKKNSVTRTINSLKNRKPWGFLHGDVMLASFEFSSDLLYR